MLIQVKSMWIQSLASEIIWDHLRSFEIIWIHSVFTCISLYGCISPVYRAFWPCFSLYSPCVNWSSWYDHPNGHPEMLVCKLLGNTVASSRPESGPFGRRLNTFYCEWPYWRVRIHCVWISSRSHIWVSGWSRWDHLSVRVQCVSCTRAK